MRQKLRRRPKKEGGKNQEGDKNKEGDKNEGDNNL